MLRHPSLERVLEVGLPVLLGTTPLVFGTQWFYPFVTYRTYLFLIASAGLFFVFLLQYGFSWRSIFRNPIVRFLSFFLGIKALTDVLGLNFSVSFWGNYERMMGLFVWLHLFVFFLMLVVVYREKAKKYREIVAALAASGGAVSLYGILQKFQVAFRIRTVDERLFSTIGNPAFLAGFLLFAIFFSIYLVATEKERARKIFWCFVLALNLVALYLTATRGALVGLGIGLVALLVAGIFFLPPSLQTYQKKIRIGVGVTFGIVLALAASLIFFRESGFVQNNLTLRRLTNISLADYDTRSRLLLWQIGWTAGREHFMLGTGENTIFALVDRHFDPALAEAWFDSSHNMILDIFLAHGVVGVLSYVVLFGTMLYQFFLARKTDAWAALLGSASLVAYLVQSFFIFDTLVVLLPLLITMAWPVVLSSATESVQEKNSDRTPWLPAGVAGIVVCVLWMFEARSATALSLASDAAHLVSHGGDTAKAAAEFGQSFDRAYFGFDSLASIVRDSTDAVLLHPAQYPANTAGAFLGAMRHAYDLAAAHGLATSQTWSDPAKIYLDIPGKNNPYLAEAITRLDRAIALSPQRIDVYYAEAQALYQMGKNNDAAHLFQNLLIQFPGERQNIFYRLLTLQSTTAPREAVIATLDQAEASGKVTDTIYDMIVQNFVQRKEWAGARDVLGKEVKAYGETARALSNLAQVYKAMGDKADARATAERLRTLDPALAPQVSAFIDSL